jgi:hypothetical protein
MLYDNAEKEIMAHAIQPNMRRHDVPVTAFETFLKDKFENQSFAGKVYVDIGPGQCDLLDLIKQRGGTTIGIDMDPAVIKLGEYRGHKMVQANLQKGWPTIDSPIDGLFCRGSINCYWFAAAPQRLNAFLEGLMAGLLPTAWLWIAPWNNPPAALPQDKVEAVKSIIKSWAQNHSITIEPATDQLKARYKIGYSIPQVEIWSKGID